MVKKCANPGMDHFSSLRWPNTSAIWVQILVPMSLVRPLAGWPDMTNLKSHKTRRRAKAATTNVMPKPSTSLVSISVCVTEGLPNSEFSCVRVLCA